MKLYLLVIVNLFLLISCKKYVPANPAFFIRASNVSVATTSGQGSGSHKITDLYLYVDGKFQGAYPVGNLMPVVTKNEPVTINIFAGIKNNGISDTRIYWTFYERLTLDTLVESGKTIERPLTFSYDSNVKFPWLENFDSGTGYSIKKSSASEVSFRIAPASESYEGKSLMVELTGDSTVAQLESTTDYELPQGSADVYLEINYKCTAPFTVGVFGDSQLKDALVVNPQDNWNKIYIQLANVVSNSPTFDKYKVYFRMVKTNDYPVAKMYLDNIKLVHF